MQLSTEQTRAARHGIDNDLSWHEINRPVGPRDIPDWCKGVHVDWVEGYGNSPRVTLKVWGDAREWPDKRFVKTGPRYIAECPDGRMEQYAHQGRVALADVKMFRSANGTLRQYRRQGSEWSEHQFGCEPGEWVEVEKWATTQQEGFGGRHVHITMVDGCEVVLRGPWHIGAPKGFAEVAYVDVSKPSPWVRRKGLPWFHQTAIAGLYLRLHLFIRIMARFAAHLPLASVTYGGCTTIETFKPEWGKPKKFFLEDQRQARAAGKAVA